MEIVFDDDLDPEIRPLVLRDENEMNLIVCIANELFYDPSRYLPTEVNIVEQMLDSIPALNTLKDDTYNLIIYSTLLLFISEGFNVFPAEDSAMFTKSKVPDDWKNATSSISMLRSTRNTDGIVQIDLTEEKVQRYDKFTAFTLLMCDWLYSLRILHVVDPPEVEIYLADYSDYKHEIVHIMHDRNPYVILEEKVAKSFVIRNRWLKFGFYLRYNMKKVFFKRIKKSQGQRVRYSPLLYDCENEGSLRATPDRLQPSDANAPGPSNMSS